MKLEINEELKNLIPPLTNEELADLTESIIKEGIREPIIIWNNTIIDGHNRYSISQQENREFKTKEIEFNNLNEAKIWMITNQLARRNLQKIDRITLVLNKKSVIAEIAKENLKTNKGNKNSVPLVKRPKAGLFEEVETLTPVNTRKELAKLAGVGEKTMSKVETIIKNNPEAANDIREGKTTIDAVYNKIKTEEKRTKHFEVRKETISFGEDIVKNENAVYFINNLEDKSIDCFLIDPPYAISYKDTRDTGLLTYEDETEYALTLLNSVMSAIKKKLKPGAHIYVFSGYTNLHTFKRIIGEYFIVQDNPIVWVKNNHTMGDFKRNYASKHEYIIFAKNENEDRLLNNPVSPDVLEYAIPQKKIHSAQKPIELLKYLIENSTIEGETVCDTFMGSGSCYEAAKETKRRFFGCEKNEEIYNIMLNKIK